MMRVPNRTKSGRVNSTQVEVEGLGTIGNKQYEQVLHLFETMT